MNAIQSLVFTAGQKAHESLYEGTLNIAGTIIPCTSSKPRKGWVLQNGLSPDTYVESIKFQKSNVPVNVPNTNPAVPLVIKMGINVWLRLSPTSPAIGLKLHRGGLLPDGLHYDFEAMDLNQWA